MVPVLRSNGWASCRRHHHPSQQRPVPIGLGRRRTDTKVTVMERRTGQLIRNLVLTHRDYQPRRVKRGNSPENSL
jgi:hypothetical protein